MRAHGLLDACSARRSLQPPKHPWTCPPQAKGTMQIDVARGSDDGGEACVGHRDCL